MGAPVFRTLAVTVFDRLAEQKALRGKHAGGLKEGYNGSATFLMMRRKPGIALFIDAENISEALVPQVMDICRKQGRVVLSQVYGPQAVIGSAAWLTYMEEYDIRPSLCVACRKGKNSVDINMVIGMMDALGNDSVDVFAIASGDCDFAPMARRAHKAGKGVMGIGGPSSVPSYRSQFDSFVCLNKKQSAPKSNRTTIVQDGEFEELQKVIDKGITANCDKKGWCKLSLVSNYVHKRMPGFSPKRYGKSKFSLLVASMGCYDVRRAKNDWCIRVKAV